MQSFILPHNESLILSQKLCAVRFLKSFSLYCFHWMMFSGLIMADKLIFYISFLQLSLLLYNYSSTSWYIHSFYSVCGTRQINILLERNALYNIYECLLVWPFFYYTLLYHMIVTINIRVFGHITIKTVYHVFNMAGI